MVGAASICMVDCYCSRFLGGTMPSTNGGGGQGPVDVGRRDSNSRAGVVIRLPIRFKGGGVTRQLGKAIVGR